MKKNLERLTSFSSIAAMLLALAALQIGCGSSKTGKTTEDVLDIASDTAAPEVAADSGDGRGDVGLDLPEETVIPCQDTDEDCTATNEHGTCSGKMKCSEQGVLECNAPIPAAEKCDEVDNDCDGATDEDASDCTNYFADNDGDGYVDPEKSACLCKPDAEGGFVVKEGEEKGDDCDDSSDSINPEQVEVCDGVDNDCSGGIDDDAVDCKVFLKDKDGDGYIEVGVEDCICEEDDETGFVVEPGDELGLDCDDEKGDVNPAATELCNGIDDDCDGVIDEYCMLCAPGSCEVCAETEGCTVVEKEAETTFEFGTDTDLPFDIVANDTLSVVANADLMLEVDKSQVSLPFLWAANNNDDTVSKVDTSTGKEVGEYRVCDDPSRTAVDTNGSVWVACRNDSRIAIIAAHPTYCIDRNGNGTIETSADVDGDGKITGDEILPTGQDECILYLGSPLFEQEGQTIWEKYNNGSCGNTGLRGLAVAGENRAYLGSLCSSTWCSCTEWGCCGANPKSIWEIEYKYDPLKPFVQGQNPKVVVNKTIETGLDYHYGIAVDQDGIIWVSTLDKYLLGRVDPKTGETKTYSMPGATYGIGIDYLGRIWTGSWYGDQALGYVFDPSDEKTTQLVERLDSKEGAVKYWWEDTNYGSGTYTRGVAPSGNPDYPYAYFMFSNDRFGVAKVRTDALKVAGIANLGANGVCSTGGLAGCGITLDGEGDLWGLSVGLCGNSEVSPAGNHGSSVAIEVDPFAFGLDVDEDNDGIPDLPYFLNPAGGNGSDDEDALVTALAELGSATYSYSDLAGYQLNTVVAPKGYYTQRLQGWGCCPGAVEPDSPCNVTTSWVSVQTKLAALPEGASVKLQTRSADCETTLDSLPFGQAIDPSSCDENLNCSFDFVAPPMGAFIDVRVVLLPGKKGASPVLAKVHVEAKRNECAAFWKMFPSCLSIKEADANCTTSSYYIDPDGDAGEAEPFAVSCDMELEGGGWTLVVVEDFESGAEGWSATNGTSTCGSYGTILGGYNVLSIGANSKTYHLKGIPHTESMLDVDFLKIDSWDGEKGMVVFGGVTVFESVFCFCTSGCQDQEPPGICGGKNICGGTWPEENKIHINAVVPHTQGDIVLEGSSTLDQDASDESWGLDNVVIRIR